MGIEGMSIVVVIGVVASVVAIVGGSVGLVLKLRRDRPKDHSEEVKALWSEITTIKTNQTAIANDIEQLEDQLESKLGIHVDAIKDQLSALREHNSRLHDRLNKLTDLMIEYFKKDSS